jgi:FkbM family methyltransferase
MKNTLVKKIQGAGKAALGVSPKLQFIYSQQRRNRNLFRKPVQTPHGFSFCGNKGMESGVFEEDEVRKIREMLATADLFINIGANIGYYVCIAASMGKKVYAFEPDTANCRLLYKNIHLNSFDEAVEVFPVALASHSGLLEIFGFGTGASVVNIWDNKDIGVLIPTNTLDQVLGARIRDRRCLFLVDVEGAEHLVLQGGTDCLVNTESEWVIEITSPGQMGNALAGRERFKSVFRLFADQGYSPFLLSDGQPVLQEEIERADRGEVSRLLGQNMFVFRRVGSDASS